MTTVPNDSCVSTTTSLGAGKTVTLQDDNKQTFALKVQHNSDIRRFAIPEPAWEPLIKKVAELFKLREDGITLKYKDEEGDLVTIGSVEELLEAHRLAIQQSILLRLYAFSAHEERRAKKLAAKAEKAEQAAAATASMPTTTAVPLELQDPFADLNSTDPKAQKRMLKEQRRQLKAQEKELKREQKRLHRESKKDDASVPFDPTKGSWREQRRALRQQRQDPAAAGDSKRWKDLTPEERLARRTARREARLRDPDVVARRCKCREGRKTRLVARFVKHVTIPDGAEVAPGQRFVKTWRLRNEGEEAWPAECKLIFISRKNGDQMSAPDSVTVPGVVEPGHELDISVDMVAPYPAGRYVGFWRLCTPEGRKFGQRIWAKIDVVCSSTSSEDEGRAPAGAAEAASTYDNLEQEVEQSFFEISKDSDGEKEAEPVAAPQPASGGKPTFAVLLKQLKELGFAEDIGRNIVLLKKHDGNIDKVIAELIA